MRGCEVYISNYLIEEMDDPATKVELEKAIDEEIDWAAIFAGRRLRLTAV